MSLNESIVENATLTWSCPGFAKAMPDKSNVEVKGE
jgi:hypothetical protein